MKNPFAGLKPEEIKALLTPHLAMQLYGETKTKNIVDNCLRRVRMADPPAGTVGSNDLGQTANTLWRIVADEWIDIVTKKYTYLDAVTTEIRDSITVEGHGVRPVVNVEMMLGAGTAIKNATNWEESALTNKYIPVTLNRISRPFGLSSYDLAHGERVGTKIGTAIAAVVAGVFADFCTLVASAMPTTLTADAAPVAPTSTTAGTAGLLTVTQANWTPEFVAHTVSALFGEYGPVEHLLLTPDALAPLVPANALALDYTAPGTYGIDRITSTAGLSAAITGGKCYGLAMRRDAVLMAAGTPDLSGFDPISVRDLGTVAGIPLLLKSWFKPGSEQMWFSVETMAGFALGNTNALYGIALTTPPAS